MKHTLKFMCLAITMFLLCSSCKKLIEVHSPVTSVTGQNVFASDATAISAVTSIYASMAVSALDGTGNSGPGAGITSLSLYCGLSADELRILDGQINSTLVMYYKNSITTSPAPSFDFWTKFYPVIYSANAAIEGMNTSTSLSATVRNQLLGEAKFIRAFCYFYLVNLYGDVPLILGTDFTDNANQPRTSTSKIYQQIVTDLSEAENTLSTIYLDGSLLPYTGTAERVRPTKWAAAALLARAYLYLGDFSNAEAQATLVIGNSPMHTLSSINSVFTKNSAESIWQIQPVVTGWNTQDARMFILPASGPTSSSSTYPVFLSTSLLSSFEIGDLRKTNWIGSVSVSGVTYYYPYKYKSATLNASVTEYLTILRLAEQYLIRAEARARQNNIAGAQGDLNVIRARAGLTATSASDKDSLIKVILHEKQVEMFTELGQRWFEVKRLGIVDSVMSTLNSTKGHAWQTTDQLFPIPIIEISENPTLEQNPGY